MKAARDSATLQAAVNALAHALHFCQRSLVVDEASLGLAFGTLAPALFGAARHTRVLAAQAGAPVRPAASLAL